jgi:excisionase family DNA binding protein
MVTQNGQETPMTGRNSRSAGRTTKPTKPQRLDTSAGNNDGPKLLTMKVEEAGKVIGISRGAAYARAKDGSLPTIRMGKRLLVPRAALDKLLACGT